MQFFVFLVCFVLYRSENFLCMYVCGNQRKLKTTRFRFELNLEILFLRYPLKINKIKEEIVKVLTTENINCFANAIRFC